MYLRVLPFLLLLALFVPKLQAQIEAKFALGLIDREGLGIEIPLGEAMSIEARVFYHGKRSSNFFIDADVNRQRRFFASTLMVKRYFKPEKEQTGFYWGLYAYYYRGSRISLDIDTWTPAQTQFALDNDLAQSTIDTRLGFGPCIGYKHLFANGITLEPSLGIVASPLQWIRTVSLSHNNQVEETFYDPSQALPGPLGYFWPNLQIAVAISI
ncbi:MAG: hypothetical protein AAF927_30790 [Bacteroidota bacterium]